MSQIKDTAQLLELSVNNAFSRASDDGEKIKILNALFASMKSFSRDWKSHIRNANLQVNHGCPPGWDSCLDGSCVPEGAGCGDSLIFIGNDMLLITGGQERRLSIEDAKDMLTRYVHSAASDYFARAQTEELQQITPLLLDVARLDFKSRLAPRTLPDPIAPDPIEDEEQPV